MKRNCTAKRSCTRENLRFALVRLPGCTERARADKPLYEHRPPIRSTVHLRRWESQRQQAIPPQFILHTHPEPPLEARSTMMMIVCRIWKGNIRNPKPLSCVSARARRASSARARSPCRDAAALPRIETEMLGSLSQISFPVRVRARVLSLGRRPKTRSYANGGREISVDYHHLAALERLGLSGSPQRVRGCEWSDVQTRSELIWWSASGWFF